GWSVGREALGQRSAADELTDQIGQAVLLTGFVDGHDSRMPQPSYTARLAQEALQLLLVLQPGAPGHLDRDNAVQVGVAGLVDGTERASADLFQEDEAADLPAAFGGSPAGGGPRRQAETGAARRADDFPRGGVGGGVQGAVALRADDLHGAVPRGR